MVLGNGCFGAGWLFLAFALESARTSALPDGELEQLGAGKTSFDDKEARYIKRVRSGLNAFGLLMVLGAVANTVKIISGKHEINREPGTLQRRSDRVRAAPAVRNLLFGGNVRNGRLPVRGHPDDAAWLDLGA